LATPWKKSFRRRKTLPRILLRVDATAQFIFEWPLSAGLTTVGRELPVTLAQCEVLSARTRRASSKPLSRRDSEYYPFGLR